MRRQLLQGRLGDSTVVEAVLDLKPEPCPASLQSNFAKLAVLAGLL